MTPRTASTSRWSAISSKGFVDRQDAFCSSTRADLDPTKVPVALESTTGEESKSNLDGLLRVVSGEANAAHADGAVSSAGLGDEQVAEELLCGLPLSPADRVVISCADGPPRSTKRGTFS